MSARSCEGFSCCLVLALSACSTPDSPTPPSPQPLSLTCSASPATGIAPLSVSLSAAVSGGPTTNSFSWAFGDGMTSGAPNTGHLYPLPGSYNATAEAHSGSDSATCSKTITVQAAAPNRAPVAVFSVTPNPPRGPAPLDVEFNACPSSDPDGNALIFIFDVGDGPYEQAHCRKEHRYTKAGTYKAKVCVNDGFPGHADQCQAYTVVVN